MYDENHKEAVDMQYQQFILKIRKQYISWKNSRADVHMCNFSAKQNVIPKNYITHIEFLASTKRIQIREGKGLNSLEKSPSS